MEELKIKIVELCNESNLPLEALLFIVKDIFRDIQETINKEKAKEKED